MREYIDRETVLNMLNRYFHSLEGNEVQVLVSDIKHATLELPTADVTEVKHGEWIMRGGWFRCSVCDERALLRDVGGTGGFSHEYHQVKTNLCPTCGAKMDGKAGDV